MDPSWKVCPVCIAPIIGWLVWLDHGKPKKVFTLHEGKMRVGSGVDCEVRILAPGVKRHHAQMTSSETGVHLVKLSDAAFMSVNFIETANAGLIDGDLFRLGEQEFKFKCL